MPELTYSGPPSPSDADSLHMDVDLPEDLPDTESTKVRISSPNDDALSSIGSDVSLVDDVCKPLDVKLSPASAVPRSVLESESPPKPKKPRLILRVRPPVAEAEPKRALRSQKPKSKASTKPKIILRLR